MRMRRNRFQWDTCVEVTAGNISPPPVRLLDLLLVLFVGKHCDFNCMFESVFFLHIFMMTFSGDPMPYVFVTVLLDTGLLVCVNTLFRCVTL